MTLANPGEPPWQLRPLGERSRLALPASSLPIGPLGIAVGREPSNNLSLEGCAEVSLHHARLELSGERLVLTDLASTNGTFVNGRRVERAELSSGDVLEFGAGGPRFVVARSAGLERTAVVSAAGTEPGASLGQTAMISLRKALGLAPPGAVDELARERVRRLVYVVLLGAVVIASLGLWALFHFQRQYAERQALLDEFEQRTAHLEALNLELGAELRERIRDADARLEQQKQAWLAEREAWEEQRGALAGERLRLEEQLALLELEGTASESQLAALRQELDKNSRALERLSPLELEESKLHEISRVRASVVLIEVRMVFRDRSSQQLVFLSDDTREVNFEGRGSPLARQSTGSGFCISDQGWILTNAHVVSPPEFKEPLPLSGEDALLPEIALAVVFSGDSIRRPARLLELDDENSNDLAVIAIEPFEGMAHLEGLDFDAPSPPPGSEVFLYGFPLGTFALQEGNRVIASTLKGILSRAVSGYLQVDAGVHPGISGGPLTDAAGRVLGVVTSVQQTPRGEIAAAIGYALPIALARKLVK